MKPEEIQKLLGGYATGTLTPEEQQALFAAALEDQELFDALGREQALRDLLRDPAAKAELLAALDAPAGERGGWGGWLRRPLAAGFVTAGVAAIAIVAVWQGTRVKPVAQAPAILAEMKAPEVRVPEAAPAVAPETGVKRKAEIPAPRDASVAKARASASQQSLEQQTTSKDMVSEAKVPPSTAPPPPPTPAAAAMPPTPPAASTQTVEVTAAAPVFSAAPLPQGFQLGALQDNLTREKLTLDARTLFYGNAFVRRDGAGTTPLVAGSGGAPSSAPKVANTSVRAATGSVSTGSVSTGSMARKESAATSLGLRVSLMRGEQEVAVATVLNPGESVRLKVTPNEDGFLYVAARDGNVWRMVANGPAQRLKPFETPPLGFEGAGQKQLYVMLSRLAQTLSPQALALLVRANMVETLAEQDRATYVVAGMQDGAPQQVVQPITLTYR